MFYDYCSAELLLLFFIFYHHLVDSYDWLVNGTAQSQVEKLIEEEHSFDEYTKVCSN